MDCAVDQPMKHFYLGTVLANPFIPSVSNLPEQEVMPHPLVESEQPGSDLRSDHSSDNTQPSSYEAGAPIQHDELDCIAEIFAGHAKSHAYRFARKPANKARVTPSREFIPDEEALFEQIEENPMFLQEPLRRTG
jgi:hypothetical protein